ncbi:MAG TPA: hypothetical protein VKA60_20395 [Blastocatellia bacterium]|nr:hypothetical protein [Blastocatellia bacterium]
MTRIRPPLILFLIAVTLRSASLLFSAYWLKLNPARIASFQDGPSYIYLATHWPLYPEPQSVIHFPLYPLVIRFFSLFTPSVEVAALVVSLLAGAMAVTIYGQILTRYSEQWFEIALVFSVFPFRWFNISQLVMSESLFLLLALFSLLLIEKGGTLSSGFVLGLACLTRLFGILLFPAFLFKVLRSRDHSFKKLVALLVPCALLAGLGVYFTARFGSPLVYFREHNRLWGGSYFSIPFSAYVEGFFDPTISWYRKPYVAFVLLFYFGGLLIGLIRWRRGRAQWAVWILWALPFLLLQTLLHGQGINWGFISSPRLMMPAAPAILLFWLDGCSRKRLYLFFALLIPLAFIYNVAEFRAQ